MATGLPSQTQVIELLNAEFTRAGYEIEDVVIDAHPQLPRITVIADGDIPLDLDVVATLSHAASALLDTLNFDSGYVLEVSSPGVQRPLTSEKHFRRARGRRVELLMSDGSSMTGRVGAVDNDGLALVVRAGRDWELKRLPFVNITKGVVQVEFSPPGERERELAGQQDQGAGMEVQG